MYFYSLYKNVVAGFFFLFLVSALALHADNFTIFNTGVDDTATVLAPGSIDPHWSIVSGADVTGTNAYTVTEVPSAWYASPTGATSTASWIAPNPDQSTVDSLSNPFSTYDYQTTFDLTGFDPTTASITGVFSTDNNLTDVLINGISTGITSDFSGFGSVNPFSITSGFQSGVNTLDFILVNGDDSDNPAGPTGLIVDSAVGTAQPLAAPEPGVISLVLFSIFTLAIMFRRKLT